MTARRSSKRLALAAILLPVMAIISLNGCFEKEKIIEPGRRVATPIKLLSQDRSVAPLQD